MVEQMTEFNKNWYWGPSPYPRGCVPVLVNKDALSKTYGVLMRNMNTGKWLIGLSGAIRCASERQAKELMCSPEKKEYKESKVHSQQTGSFIRPEEHDLSDLQEE